ncbi:MAG: glycosyltransferase [Lachnospiraceae bacterium]|nr:glycosyltransferase [Lachnospiraceae bacterium]
MADPKISIIVPVYNAEADLERAVSSLINQTLKEIEIILVDDGSTDQSAEICNRFSREDSRVIAIHKKNEGQGIARNTGLKEAKGEYICFMDSDDHDEPKTCEIAYRSMIESGADLCVFGYCKDDASGRIKEIPYITGREYEGEEVRTEFLPHFFGDDPSKNELRGFSINMSCFRNDIIKDNGIEFPSERKVFSEDTAFCLEYCGHVNKVVAVPDILNHYCDKADSFSRGFNPDKMAKTMEMLDVLRAYAARFDVEDIVKIRLSMYVWVNLMSALRSETAHAEVTGSRPAKARIQKLCLDRTITDMIAPLKEAGLPFGQKLLLKAFLNKDVPGIMMICKGREKLKR